MKCIKCGQEFKPPQDGKDYIVCGSCADDLRQENAYQAFIDEQESINDQVNREAYEERESERHIDDGCGWRYS